MVVVVVSVDVDVVVVVVRDLINIINLKYKIK